MCFGEHGVLWRLCSLYCTSTAASKLTIECLHLYIMQAPTIHFLHVSFSNSPSDGLHHIEAVALIR